MHLLGTVLYRPLTRLPPSTPYTLTPLTPLTRPYILLQAMAVTGAASMDIVPSTEVETGYTVACGIFGIFVMAILIGGCWESLSEMHELADRTHRALYCGGL